MKTRIVERLATLLILVALFVSACRFDQQSRDARDAVYKASAAYNVALVAAVKYAQLPRCAPSAPRVCSEQATVDRIVAAESVATTAIREAERIARDPAATDTATAWALSSAQAALATLTALTAALPTPEDTP